MNEEKMRSVEVLNIQLDGSTVAQGEGIDTETKERIRFAGEPRMMQVIGAAIELDEEPIVAIVPEWAVLGVTS